MNQILTLVKGRETTTQTKTIGLISWIADVPISSICPTTNIREDLGLDSIDFMLLIVKLEKNFNISLSSEEVERIETVKDATDYIHRYVAELPQY